jgi:hypothetical protein
MISRTPATDHTDGLGNTIKQGDYVIYGGAKGGTRVGVVKQIWDEVHKGWGWAGSQGQTHKTRTISVRGLDVETTSYDPVTIKVLNAKRVTKVSGDLIPEALKTKLNKVNNRSNLTEVFEYTNQGGTKFVPGDTIVFSRGKRGRIVVAKITHIYVAPKRWSTDNDNIRFKVQYYAGTTTLKKVSRVLPYPKSGLTDTQRVHLGL